MSLVGRLTKRVRAAVSRSRLEREMQAEMQLHIEQAAERFRSRGMSEADAMRAARREFGNIGFIQEHGRDARGARWIESLIGDAHHAARQYRRAPLLAVTIVLVLTLGIGAASAGVSFLNGAILRPAPGVPNNARLVAVRGIETVEGRRTGRPFSYPELMDYAAIPQLEEVAGWTSSVVATETGGREPVNIGAQFVTPNFFRALGLQPATGRFFSDTRADAHDTPELAVVLGYQYAVEAFGQPATAVGETIRVNGINATVTGVAPARFAGAYRAEMRRVLWMPVSAWPLVDRVKGDPFGSREKRSFHAIARLRTGTSVDEALPGIRLVASRAAQALGGPVAAGPGGATTFAADAVPLRGEIDVTSTRVDAIELAGIVTVLVVLVLLLCTTTVSSLLVGTALTRRHEIAVRLAMGASRARIVRQLVTETTVLAFVAGVAGIAVYAGMARALRPQLYDINIDPSWSTAAATAVLALAASLLCGLSPALHATRDELATVLKASSTSATAKSRLQRTFVLAQVALTQPLLVVLVMTIAILLKQGDHDRRPIRDNVVRAEFETWSAASREEKKMPALTARYAALPGVVAVIPQVSGYRVLRLEAPASEGAPARRFDIRTQDVPPGYFRALSIRLIRGRELVDADAGLRATPIVIGSDLAVQAFGAADPIGKRLATISSLTGQKVREVEVVGVVDAEEIGSSQFGGGMRVFTPMSGNLSAGSDPDVLLIRTATPAQPFIGTLREIARAEMPMTPVFRMQTLAEIDREQRGEVIEATTASAIGGMITLLLASIGLYAIVALGVSRRRREIGIRISVGATPAQVVGLFFRDGVSISLLGLAIGLPLSVVALNALSAQVGAPRTDMPVVAAVVAVVVVAVAAVATWIPARRAAGVDPLVALRDA